MLTNCVCQKEEDFYGCWLILANQAIYIGYSLRPDKSCRDEDDVQYAYILKSGFAGSQKPQKN